ncbi:MAG: CBS domain-containing protein [Actinomycetota bacterium]|nr:CBS domain-containing protein [Actinomycetota bacterium]
MKIGELIGSSTLMIGPDDTLRSAAKAMVERRVGSCVVVTEDGSPAILTERDILRATASGVDADQAKVAEYMTPGALTASWSWDPVEAAERMRSGGFRHLIVMADDGSIAGVLSMRDLMGVLLDERKSG